MHSLHYSRAQKRNNTRAGFISFCLAICYPFLYAGRLCVPQLDKTFTALNWWQQLVCEVSLPCAAIVLGAIALIQVSKQQKERGIRISKVISEMLQLRSEVYGMAGLV